jgi:hypothetical protein
MKNIFILTITFALTLSYAFGQTTKSKDTSELKIRGKSAYYIDGFKVHSNLTKSDSIKILKDVVSKLNGKWTSTEKIGSTETKYTWEYKLNDTTFKGYLFNLDIILAAPFVRLQIINGQIKIIHSRTIGEWFIDDSTENIRVTSDELTIGDVTYKRLKED